MDEKRITFIDLFAGAGGLSEGFVCTGYTPVAHVEMNADACHTLRTRTCYHYLKQHNNLGRYYDYLRSVITRDELYSSVPETVLNSVIHQTMNEATMESIFAKIDNAMKVNDVSHIDLIIGGPPCQAYSQVGRSRKCMDNDPRNDLYKLYCQVLKKYEPELFVFENVPGLLTAGNGKYLDSIQSTFKSMDYEVKYDIIQAFDFGVLQRRRRVILIGWKQGANYTYPCFSKIKHSYIVNDVLVDLPNIQAGCQENQYNHGAYSEYLKDTRIRTADDVLTWHLARRHTERDREIYRKAITAWNDGHRRMKYSSLPDELITHKNRSGFLDRFKVLAADLPASHTIMAHISKDGHYYIHPDIEQVRSITVREAARIQSFPDNYFFEGSRTAAFRQIGNAVPPIMAKGIAEALAKDF